MTDPLSLGFIGRNGAFPANEAGRHADVVIAIGARFDDRSASSWMPGYSWNFPHAKLIHVDVDPDELGRNYPPDLGILADARTFLRQLLAELEKRGAARSDATEAPGTPRSRAGRQEWDEIHRGRISTSTPRRSGPSASSPIARRCCRTTRSSCCDVGVNHNWYMQFWKARRPQTMLNSWGFSGMGFGAAGALGAKLAAPDRPVVAIAGDGCFTMVPHVLCTAVEYNIPVVWVIWNNFGWVSIRDIQFGMFGGRELGTTFYRAPTRRRTIRTSPPGRAPRGVEAITVTKSQDFKGALEHAVKANKPFLLDVHVDAEVRPPSTGAWQLPPTPYKEPVFGKRFCPTRRRRSRGSSSHGRPTAQGLHPQHRRGAVAGISQPFRRRAVEAVGDAGDRGLAAHRLSHLDVSAEGLCRNAQPQGAGAGLSRASKARA